MTYGGTGSYYSGYYTSQPYGGASYYGEGPYAMPMPGAGGYYDQDQRGLRNTERNDRGTQGSPSQSGAKPPEDESQSRGPAPATLIVRLPADAKLTIDDEATKETSDLRTFVSPPIQPGKNYRYTLKAEIIRNGRTLTSTTQATVRAGEQTQVTLEFPAAGVARR
jgi:uncharacterized protein (TIGR03000 family)